MVHLPRTQTLPTMHLSVKHGKGNEKRSLYTYNSSCTFRNFGIDHFLCEYVCFFFPAIYLIYIYLNDTASIKQYISWSKSTGHQTRHLKREVCSCSSRCTDCSPKKHINIPESVHSEIFKVNAL